MGTFCSTTQQQNTNTTNQQSGLSDGAATNYSDVSGTTSGTQSGSSSGTTTSVGGTTNLLANQLAGSADQLRSQQAAAAGAQADISSGLTNAVSTTAGLGQSGLGDVTRYMAPWQQQAQAGLDLSNQNFEKTLQGIGAAQGKTGALGNNTGNRSQLNAAQVKQLTDNAMISDLANKGFTQSLNASQADAAAKLAGATASGTLGAQETGFNFQNKNLGADIATKYANAISGNAAQAGSTNYNTGTNIGQTSGTTGGTSATSTTGGNAYTGRTSSTGSGTQNTNSSQTPSTLQSILAGLGMFGSFFSDARIKEGVDGGPPEVIGQTHLGDPIYLYSKLGGPPEIGLIAQDVEQRDPDAVGEIGGIKTVDYARALDGARERPARNGGAGGFADGGAVAGLGGGGSSNFMRHLDSAFKYLEGRSAGGKVGRPGASAGGWEPEITDMGPMSAADADAMVDTAKSNQWGHDLNKWGDVAGGISKAGSGLGGGEPIKQDLGPLQQLQGSMAQMMARVPQGQQGMPRALGGGVPGMYAGGDPDHHAAYDDAGYDLVPFGTALDYEPPMWAAPRLGAADPIASHFATAPRALDVAPTAPTEVKGARDDARMPPPRYEREQPPPRERGFVQGVKDVFSGNFADGLRGLTANDAHSETPNWGGKWGPTLMAASGPLLLGPAASNIMGQRKEMNDKLIADRQAQMKLWEMMGTGPGGQETLHGRQHAENQRLHDATIRASNVGADINEEKLAGLRDPMRAYDQREKVADRLGLKPGSRERSEFIATGDFPKANRDSLSVLAAEREAEARRLGIDPTSDQGREYILTGKMKGQELTPAQQTKVYELDDKLAAAGSARESIGAALELNKTTYEGMGASQQAWLLSLLGPSWTPEKATNTIDMDNVLRDRVLSQLKATFGGNPTNSEREALMAVAGSVNTPAENRKRVLERALAEVAKREAREQKMKEELLGRTYFKKPGAPAAAPETAPPPQPPSVPAGSLYSASRKMWKAPDGSMYDERGNPVAGAP